MDFGLSDEQQAISDLAKEVLADACTPEALRAAESDPASPGFDRRLWVVLAEAGLLGVCVPEEHGGLGLGLVELALLLEQAGRTVAPVPLLLLTTALVEALGDERTPATTARRDGDGWVLDGTKVCVPAGLHADRVLVSATTDSGAALFLVDPTATGVQVQRQETISYVPEAVLVLDQVRVGADALVGAPDGAALCDVLQVATTATCAVLAGVSATAVRLTADYTKAREQFGHPIALFQAVGQRTADAFIDTRTIRLTMLQAVWRLAEHLPAEKEVAVAKYFASDAGQRVVRAATHLHGGMGVSREYPLHRYYVWAKQLELTLGGGTRQLVALGRLLAEEPART